MAIDQVRILLVDDNEGMRAILALVLRAIGIRQVIQSPAADDAWERLRQEPFDILMTDLSMEGMDGIELTRKVRNDPASPTPMMPIIMVTGHSSRARVEAARDAGITEFLTKPVTPRGVILRVQQIIEHPRAFIRTETYFGPDRRRQVDFEYKGPERRKDGDLAALIG